MDCEKIDMSLYGEFPTSPVVFAACDSKYFLEHAPSFIYSATDHKFDVHIHIVNPTNDVLSLAAILSSTTHKRVTYSFHDFAFNDFDSEQERAYYACTRFAVAPHVLKTANKVMILDIDCLIMNDFEFPDLPVGYFPRKGEVDAANNWERQGMKVAAGAVYYNIDALNVAEAVSATIEGLPVRWFNDQIALSHIIDQLMSTTKVDPDDILHEFDSTFLDWEFKSGTSIWTGKGSRKYDNEKYVSEKARWNKLDHRIGKGYTNVILKPRLDLPFKKQISIENSVNEPIRKHWSNFVEKKNEQELNTLVIEAPRWHFNDTICKYFTDQIIFAPHVEKSWWGGGNNVRYYMQTVFPWIFTIDKIGYLGGSEYKNNYSPEIEYGNDKEFEKLQKYVKAGGTKFKHLQGNNDWSHEEPYVLVPLQLPHDETIKYHSNITVPELVKAMCEWAEISGIKVVFKGHPINKKSMEPLVEIIQSYTNVEYHLDYPINSMIADALAVYSINSGTGQEAMLYERPVVVFGKCDYENAVIKGDINDLEGTWRKVINDDESARVISYKNWFSWFITQVAYDTKKS